MPYIVSMETVVETPAYLTAANDAGMSTVERTAAVDLVSANPEAGDLIVGTGGCRKSDWPARGGGSRAAIA
jgi:hypothetical protein